MKNICENIVPYFTIKIKEGLTLGRKRTSTKRDLKLYVEEDLVEKLNILKVNKSVLFEKAALQLIKELEEKEEKYE